MDVFALESLWWQALLAHWQTIMPGWAMVTHRRQETPLPCVLWEKVMVQAGVPLCMDVSACVITEYAGDHQEQQGLSVVRQASQRPLVVGGCVTVFKEDKLVAKPLARDGRCVSVHWRVWVQAPQKAI